MLTESQISAWRLTAQQLHQPRWQRPEQVVSWMGGVQAQYDDWARWSVGLRMPNATDADVARAIASRQIVRTWAFRGTLHYIAASDLPWLIPLLAPVVIHGNARRYRQLTLDEATFAQSNEVIRRALQHNRELIRTELVGALEQAGISAEGQRAPYLLQRAALDGVICHGPQHDGEPAYVLLCDWVGPSAEPDTAAETGDRLARLAQRYFASHGPATVQDFAWWSGLPVSRVRQATKENPSLERVESTDKELWAAQERGPPSVDRTAHLLPPFDDYLLDYRDRSLALHPSHAKEVNRGGGMPRPTILLDGEVVGVWSRTPKRGQMKVVQSLFRPLDEGESAAVAGAAQRYGAFWSLPVLVESQRAVDESS